MSDISLPPTPKTVEQTSTLSRPSSSSSLRSSIARKRKQREDNDETTELLQLAGERLRQKEDSFDVFGKHIANKLRGISKIQNIFAQKLINDIIFEAELEALTKDYKVLNCRADDAPSNQQSCQKQTDFDYGAGNILSNQEPHPISTNVGQSNMAGPNDFHLPQQRMGGTSDPRADTSYINYSCSEALSQLLTGFNEKSS